MRAGQKMIATNRCSKSDLSRTNTTSSLQDQALSCIDIGGKSCSVGIKKRHIKGFKGATESKEG
jgi:hypothetical protein